jgi:hypothetical protein
LESIAPLPTCVREHFATRAAEFDSMKLVLFALRRPVTVLVMLKQVRPDLRATFYDLRRAVPNDMKSAGVASRSPGSPARGPAYGGTI